ncbi:hypothetical protein CC77DRAFT_1022534 [Alternaria alternata]|jgi:hypothetical protein|uniref:F-box domain-containing protein n=2 Tax=Alternaria alternata complex TaxID=187734 RepID=A0A177DEZ3_ALTAL|nr:hypothetical protein CC77DRAFT_1022534 [Alternaria alternata]XP_051592541.1 uncharacterized protein J4E82_001381 [Alternaria postmessia]RYN29642.1 hypothetical protein AA0115_g5466 [Alternaria tenuissima]KAH6858307.1 hypothetical protein B0T12DRAFT_455147 [Alternaria alternata]KAI5379838.1 hypothetical protein J4E82_001381 [Alternaria postmessia]OAG18323.1 hypothetical protein CC77DRAFT_1022534 [Alternaria alternata]OWY52450.1 hypothetical protein AALT_g2815 [Alternaria alternata]
MVNAKYVAFTVNKQTPFLQTPDQAYATVINCRRPGGKRAGLAQEVRSHNVPLAMVEGSLKRKRGDEGRKDSEQAANPAVYSGNDATTPLVAAPARQLLNQQWQQRKPTRLRRGKILSKGVDLDCWFIILSYSDPAQLLEMRSKIASCYRFLRDNPMLWKHSRDYYYGNDMPDPPPGLTEFQFAHLRHGHGCMDCGAPNTRKTFWAFLRRMCKDCLNNQVVKEYDAIAQLRGLNGEDVSYIRAALPSGIFDSWGNFVGVGPASTHALKTIYLRSDVQKLVAEFHRESREKTPNTEETAAWWTEWLAAKAKQVEERQMFAKKMEQWEEMQRTARTSDYNAKKSRRKNFFKEKALQLTPPISVKELEACPAYKRAITIPKDPNNTSWDLLKPKIVKEAAENAAKRNMEESRPPTASNSGISTPTSSLDGYPHPHPYLGMIMGMPPHNGHLY